MKKIIAILISLSLALFLFASCNKTDKNETPTDSDDEAITQDGISYVMLEDGTAKITGFNKEVDKEYQIPSTLGNDIKVTVIGSSAFADNNKLYQVKLPRYITEIEENAFSGSSVHIVLLTSCRKLEKIDKGAFSNCTNLAQVDISSSVKTIEDDVFAGCTSLRVCTFRGNTDGIPASAFTNVGENLAIWTYEDNMAVKQFATGNNFELKILPRAVS